jgi:hypothetical protein
MDFGRQREGNPGICELGGSGISLHLCEGCRENYFSHTFQISVLEAKGQLIIWTMAILL